MMSLSLCVPGLIWPNPAFIQAASQLELPGLAYLLGRGQLQSLPGMTLDDALLGEFGLRGHDVPLAYLRRLGEPGLQPIQGGHWLCADPVHLHFARDTLLLADIGDLPLPAEQLDELILGLNRDFADIGHFVAADPARWYLELTEPVRARFPALAEVIGRPMKLFVEEDELSRPWRRLSNEIQVWLHNHPLNATRAEHGMPAINGVWLWGSGADLPALTPPATRLHADAPLARGLAQAACGDVQPLPRSFADWQAQAGASSSHWVLHTAAYRPVLYLDVDPWRQALQGLERDWFSPLADAVRRGRLTQCDLFIPGDKVSARLQVTQRQRWQFWRRPRPLTDLASLLPADLHARST